LFFIQTDGTDLPAVRLALQQANYRLHTDTKPYNC